MKYVEISSNETLYFLRADFERFFDYTALRDGYYTYEIEEVHLLNESERTGDRICHDSLFYSPGTGRNLKLEIKNDGRYKRSSTESFLMEKKENGEIIYKIKKDFIQGGTTMRIYSNTNGIRTFLSKNLDSIKKVKEALEQERDEFLRVEKKKRVEMLVRTTENEQGLVYLTDVNVSNGTRRYAIVRSVEEGPSGWVNFYPVSCHEGKLTINTLEGLRSKAMHEDSWAKNYFYFTRLDLRKDSTEEFCQIVKNTFRNEKDYEEALDILKVRKN